MPEDAFIDLDRQFIHRDPSRESESLAEQSISTWFPHKAQKAEGWVSLVGSEFRIIVILGEPGSGRTFEFRNKVDGLRAEGMAAFYMLFSDLANTPDRLPLDSERSKEFERWNAGLHEGYFFLDAVDEAKLESTAAFRRALRNFSLLIEKRNLRRCKIFISCRVHQWEPVEDEVRVLESFAIPKTGSTKDGDARTETLRSYVILPLDEERIRLFARSKYINDSKAFLEAIRSNHCWDFAGRPYDIEFLINYWRKNGRLDSLDRMIDHFVWHQLEERKDDAVKANPIDLNKLRGGAETLAAASILCNRLDFQSLTVGKTSVASLIASRCLPTGWGQREIRILFDRPLFTALSYGHIRFHHRRTSEFLAADWFRNRMDEISTRELEEIFFSKVEGSEQLRLSRESVAVWLCCISQGQWAEKLKKMVVRICPDAFFRHGDPKLLSPVLRSDVIESFVLRHEDFDLLSIDMEDPVIARFGDPAVYQIIKKHLEDQNVPPGVKISLLDLAVTMEAVECADIAASLVFSDTNRVDLPSAALRLVSSVGGVTQRQIIAEQIGRITNPRPSFAGELIWMLYPDFILTQDVENLLRAIDSKGDSVFISWELVRTAEKLEDRDLIIEMAEMVLRFSDEPMRSVNSRLQNWSNTFGEVGVVLFEKGMNLEGLRSEEEEILGSLLWRLRSSDSRVERANSYNRSKNWPDLDLLSLHHPNTRRIAFWKEISAATERSTRKEMAIEGYWTFTTDMGLDLVPNTKDVEWLFEEVELNFSGMKGEISFRFLCVLWEVKILTNSKFWKLKKISKLQKEWRNFLSASVRYRRFRWYYKIKVFIYRWRIWGGWWWSHQWRRLETGLWNVKNCMRMLKNLKSLRDGSDIQQLFFLLRVASDSSLSYLASDLTLLGAEYQKRVGRLLSGMISEAFRKGCIAVWEDFSPDIKKSTRRGVVGAMGLSLVWSEGQLDFSQISAGKAQRCARYAFQEINEFPHWFDDLVLKQANAVKGVLIEALVEEWFQRLSGTLPNYLTRLDNPGNIAVELVHEFLLFMLRKGDPDDSAVLRTVQSILARGGVLRTEEWAFLSETRLRNYSSSSPKFAAWMLIWIQVDAGRAMDFIERNEKSVLSKQPCDNFLVNVCAWLLGEARHPAIISPASNWSALYAERWIRLVYKWVNPRDDRYRPSGVAYSPEDRDHAQTYRGRLFHRLLNLSHNNVTQVIDSLIDSEEFAAERNFLHQIKLQYLRKKANDGGWDEDRFREFANGRELQPKNIAELFQLISRRFYGIKHDVENAEESIRSYFRVEKKEEGLQSFLVRRLREGSAGKYTVPKETEIDRKERPDFQIHNPLVLGSIQAEVKFADLRERSYENLKKGIREQLYGKYLRDNSSCYGFFVVGTADKSRRWQHSITNDLMDFDELIRALEEVAEEIEEESNFEKTIRVIGIDFSI